MTCESAYRHVAFALTSIIGLLLLMFGVIAALLASDVDGNTFLSVFLWTVGVIVALAALTFLSTYAKHRWTIEPNAVRIEEVPRVLFFGFTRRRTIPFADIAGLRNLESGLDVAVELVARDGKTYRIMAQETAAAPLKEFAAALVKSIEASGAPAPAITEGLSFWNTVPGLAVLGVALSLTLLFAFAALFVLFDGGLETWTRSGEFVALAAALPFGMGYVIYKSLRRRWRVLSALSKT
jgi:membrane protein YdbS with pleckstrin-like domain